MDGWVKGEFGLVFFQSSRPLKVVICTALKQNRMYALVQLFPTYGSRSTFYGVAD